MTILNALYNKNKFKDAITQKNILKFNWESYFSAFKQMKINMAENIYWYFNTPKSINVAKGCKTGLEMGIVDRNIKTHFLLDKINFDDVLENKKSEVPQASNYTNSGLRYAYRNKERLNGCVQFYHAGREVATPWEQDRALWQTYIAKSAARAATL